MLKDTINKIFTKKNLQRAGVGVVLCAAAMGSFSFYHHQAKAAEREQLREAENAMVAAQAAQQSISLIDESQLKSIVAQNIGIEEGNISDFKASLFDLNNPPPIHNKHGHNGWKHDNDNRPHNGGMHGRNRENCPDTSDCPYNNQQAPMDNMTPPQAPPQTMDKAAMPQPPAMPSPDRLLPMYKVTCSANNINYDVCIDAQSGKVMRSHIRP